MIFFDDVYFFFWTSIFSIYLLLADIWEEFKSTLAIWHIAGKHYNWWIL